MDDTHVSIELPYFETYEWRSETFTRGQAWVDLVSMADAQGKIEISKLTLSKRWHWGRQKVFQVLGEWENRQRIRQHPTPMLTVIDILNHDCYQATSQAPRKPAETSVKKTAKPKPHTKPKDTGDFIIAKDGERLSGKMLKNFTVLWEAFGYKKGRAEAAQSFIRLVAEMKSMADDAAKKTLWKAVLAGARREAQARPALQADGRTPKMLQGWLTARRWEDEAHREPTKNDPPKRKATITHDMLEKL